MSFFTQLTEIVQIDAENSVTLKMPSVEDRIKIMDPIAHLMGESNLRFGLHAQIAACVALIVSWSGPGFEGRDVSPENIKALPPHVFDPVAEKAIEMVGALDGADNPEKK